MSAPHLSQIRSAVPARQTGAAISLSQQCGSQHTRTAATAHWLWLGWTPRPKPEQPDPNPALAKGIPLTSSPPLSLSLSLLSSPLPPHANFETAREQPKAEGALPSQIRNPASALGGGGCELGARIGRSIRRGGRVWRPRSSSRSWGRSCRRWSRRLRTNSPSSSR